MDVVTTNSGTGANFNRYVSTTYVGLQALMVEWIEKRGRNGQRTDALSAERSRIPTIAVRRTSDA